jgi:hypothetical protein
MRQERTVQASLFDLFAGHEIGIAGRGGPRRANAGGKVRLRAREGPRNRKLRGQAGERLVEHLPPAPNQPPVNRPARWGWPRDSGAGANRRRMEGGQSERYSADIPRTSPRREAEENQPSH